MFKILKSTFGRQHIQDKLRENLRHAELLLLNSEDAYEYARAMSAYHSVRVEQLRKKLKTIGSTP